AIEILTEPCTLTDGAHHGAKGGAIPADLGNAAIIGHRMQLECEVLRVREALHRAARKYLLEQGTAFDRHAGERCGIFTLQVNADRAHRAADAAEEISLDREHARIGQPHGDLLAHQLLELTDALLIDDTRPDGPATWPGEDVPVPQMRLPPSLHVGLHPFEHARQQLAIDRLGAHARWKIEERVDGGTLHRRQVIE